MANTKFDIGCLWDSNRQRSCKGNSGRLLDFLNSYLDPSTCQKLVESLSKSFKVQRKTKNCSITCRNLFKANYLGEEKNSKKPSKEIFS